MSSLTPEQWHRISSYLEEALTLTGDDQERWLEELQNKDPELAAQVQSFLKDQQDADSKGFMAAGPSLPLLSDGEVEKKSTPIAWSGRLARAAWERCGWPSAVMGASSATPP